MKGKRILLLANDSTYVYNLRFELINKLVLSGCEVIICCEIKQYVQELEHIGCRMISLNVPRHGKNPLQDMSLYISYSKLIKREHPDAVLTYNIKPNVYGGMACRRYHVPYLENICGLGTPVENPGLLQKLTVFLYRIGVKKASCVFFQNQENEDFFNARNIAPGHHHLLPGSGVNLEKFKLLDYPKSDKTEFLYISRVMKQKGIDQYLEAASIIHRKYPDTVFNVVGACDDDSYLEKLEHMQNAGIIRYHGQQSDIQSFHAFSSCTVHPTYYPEGMSNVLLESAASGRPIITTDRSGCREIIENGVNGYICRQQDVDDLVSQIEKFLALSYEERKAMGLAGRLKMEHEFDRNIVVSAYIDELESVFNS